MRAFIIRRLVHTVFTVLTVSFIAFMLVHLIPGDPVTTILGLESSPQEAEKLRRELWLDRPLLIQYGHWLHKMVRGDFGLSLQAHEKVLDLIAKSGPISLLVSSLAILLGAAVGIPAGVISAVRRGKFVDSLVTVASNLGVAIPIFWLGILFIYLFGLKLGWLPILGYTSPFEDVAESIQKLIMPVVCLSVYPTAFLARQTRSSMLEVIHQDYIRTAWAKGLQERIVISRHALKNAFSPVVTMFGIIVAQLAGGAVLTETIFNIPGMGRLIVRGVLDSDYGLVQAATVMIALLVALINLVVDISYAWFDPRIRYK